MRENLWEKSGQIMAVVIAFSLPVSTAATTVAMLAILCCWCMGGDYTQKRAFLFEHPLMRAIWPLIIMTVIGVLYSVGEPVAVRRALMDGLRLLSIPCFMFYYRVPRFAHMALWAFCAAMILTLFLAFLKVYGGVPIGTKFSIGAIFKSHIKTSFFMAIAAFFLFCQANQKIALSRRVIYLSLVMIMLYYLLFMSAGRIGYLTLGMCGIFFAWQRAHWKGIGIALLVMTGLFGGAYKSSSVFSERINILSQDMRFYQEGGRLSESSLGSRLHFAFSSVELMEGPIGWGSGTGSFGKVYSQFIQGDNTLYTDNPHNEYLRIGVELGIVGLLCLLWMFFQQWRLSGQLPGHSRFFFQGTLAAFFVGCLFNSWLKDFTEGYFYCVITAIGFSRIPLPLRQWPSVSVIVTTYNWPQALDRVLCSLAKQDYGDMEVIIADDGSSEATGVIINKWRKQCSFPLIHCWQRDQGFRAAMIRNRAVALARGEYLIFMDGDCVVLPSFVRRHAQLARKGWWVAGNRILLNASFTEAVLKQGLSIHRWGLLRWLRVRMAGQCNRFISFLCFPLGRLRRLQPFKWQGAKTCNLGVWREDIMRVNGFDERFEGWGLEDTDCVMRLQRAGIYHQSGRYSVPVLHLWHPTVARDQLDKNRYQLAMTEKSTIIYAGQGVEQYLE